MLKFNSKLAFRKRGADVSEISPPPPPIRGVETAVPVFIGYTQKAEQNRSAQPLRNIPVRISSMPEFSAIYGTPQPEAFLLKLEDAYDAGGVLVKRQVAVTLPSPSLYKLCYSLQLYFANGGGPCYIISVGDYSRGVMAGKSEPKEGLLGGIAAAGGGDEPTLLVLPDAASLDTAADYTEVVQAALAQCSTRKDRFTILDAYEDGNFSAMDALSNQIGNDHLQYGAAYCPNLMTTLTYQSDDSSMVTHLQSGAVPSSAPVYSGSLGNLKSTAPHLYNSLVAEIGKVPVELPPSGAMAGVYATVDRSRGVWRAPTNVQLKAVLAPKVQLASDSRDALLASSINPIREFAGKGVVVWGARTLAGNDNEWRYVPVRRFISFIEASIRKGTMFVPYAPNDGSTWLLVKTMIRNFLFGLWKQGAMPGIKPEEAFFVLVGPGESMTLHDIQQSVLRVQIGIAFTKPAEFIIISLTYELYPKILLNLPG